MKVILLKDVRNVGQYGDVKEVADGYARNFLFSKKLAEPATKEKVAELEQKRVERAAHAKADEEDLDKKINFLRGKTARIAARTTEKGGLFKTVSARDAVAAIHEQHSVEIPESSIHFSEPVKTVGEHVAELRGFSVKAEFGIIVASVS